MSSALVSTLSLYKMFDIHWKIIRFTSKQENKIHKRQTHELPWFLEYTDKKVKSNDYELVKTFRGMIDKMNQLIISAEKWKL